jgi:hypothetical protein
MSVHSAYLLDPDQFREEVAPIIQEVDCGDFETLRERACESVTRMQDDWPFARSGDGRLPEQSEIRRNDNPSQSDIGYWFRVILAEHLEECSSPGGNWSVLYEALQLVGWDVHDRDLLFKGRPSYQLLKREGVHRQEWPLSPSSEYWHRLHPQWTRSGWLENTQIARLVSKLTMDADKLREIDLKDIESIKVDDGKVIAEFEGYLEDAVRDTVGMLTVAENRSKGLFMTISVYA